ncbi:MAG: DNA ligase D [Bacteroidota bacterium]
MPARGKQSGTDGRAGRSHKAASALRDYAGKRDFTVTGEPAPAARRRKAANAETAAQFVVQKHAARNLHYDFRLELDGTLKSWAIPKGPSLDPQVRRLAVHVEDHPLAYAGFEGRIPAGQYGAGEVIVWDRGSWQADDPDPLAAYQAGKLKFHLLGDKLSGGWMLVRTRQHGSGKREQWLLIKERDAAARAQDDYDIVADRPESTLSHARLAERAAAPDSSPNKLTGARPAALPASLAPQLASLVESPPAGDWHYEIKFDGYRLLSRVEGNNVRLFTRNGLDWTARLPPLARAIAALDLPASWLDGEIVVLDQHGHPDFQAVQNAFETGRSDDIVYYLFDLPWHGGFDLRAVPLEQRRTLLAGLLAGADPARLRYSADISTAAGDILRRACELKLEGLIGKRAGSPYVSARNADWIKLKCRLRQEFVIGGHTAPQGSRRGFGALLLGVHDENGTLRYVGRVGSGFSDTSLHALAARMQPLKHHSSPFAEPLAGREAAGVTWLEPRLGCEVEFTAWTREGMIRHAVFLGLRDDKPAPAIGRETPTPATAARKVAADFAGIAISHPDRLIDAESGLTKAGLAAFYRDIAPYLLPHLIGRPLSLLRAPDGIAGQQFFQRHAETLAIPGIRLLAPELDPGHKPLMAIDSLPALIGAVQMGGIEFHTWNVDSAHIDRPDRLILDLDPDPAMPWRRILEATGLVLTLLDELGLKAFLKTSGGKGMHVVVPLSRRHDWTLVKDFSQAVAQHLARLLPRHFADRMGPQNRVGRIFVDYLRNQKGGSTIAAYSVRARPGLPVSVPIARTELEQLNGAAAWTVRNLAARLEKQNADPWAGYANNQVISRAMRQRLGMA